jgi:hypothetical protein
MKNLNKRPTKILLGGDLMEYKELQEYGMKQYEKGLKSCKAATKKGIIIDITKVYEDLKLPKLYVLQRKAPINLLVFLYPCTLTYLPPTTKENLQQILGMDLNAFIELAKYGLVRPLIGHATYYAELPHFDPIFELKPPAIWDRSYAVVDAMGKNELFEDGKKKLPLEKITNVPWIRKRWTNYYPVLSRQHTKFEERIKTDFVNYYVDLCIFGHKALADIIAYTPSANDVALQLIASTEVISDPWLIGLGGSPQYLFDPEQYVRDWQKRKFHKVKPFFIPQVAKCLLDELELSFPEKVSIDEILQFHRDNLSADLWRVISDLKKEVKTPTGELKEVTTDIKAKFREVNQAFPSFIEERRKWEKRLKWILRIGACASGVGILEYLPPVVGVPAGITVGRATYDLTIKQMDWLLNKILTVKFTPFTVSFWSLQQKIINLKKYKG